MPRPSEQLQGYEVNGWRVVQPLARLPGQTGSRFSVGYLVQKGSVQAYMKAMDYVSATRAADTAAALQRITAAILFERHLLRECGEKGFTKVVKLLDSGTVYLNGHEGNLMAAVEWLIFELAEGDVRRIISLGADLDAEWSLKALHQIATGLSQLHRHNIVHQDLKPSNVLAMPADAREGIKIADLGSAAAMVGPVNPRAQMLISGDPDYAPLEFHYRYQPPEWVDRREACDAYLLGSMVAYFFSGVGMTQSMLLYLEKAAYPGVWKGGFQDVLPSLMRAHALAVAEVESGFPLALREELKAILVELTDPDPHRRGDRKARLSTGRPVGLDRFVSKFDRLAKRAAILNR